MVFSPVAPFLDHNNWHQQQQSNHQQENDHGGVENPNFQSPTVPPQHAGGEGSIRPGSMVDRARLAKLPMPEPGLPCPRCESTNTKFCYFNNYSLTQPRHFCKMCRRYWTRGGALRNVPVGGGCRRNKRSNKHSRRSKSPSQKGTKCLSGSSPSRCSNENIGTSTHLAQPPSLQMPFMSAYGGVGSNIIRSSLGGFHPPSEMSGFHLGSGGSNGSNLSNISSIGSGESWRLPFLAGFEVPNNNTNLFLYQSEGAVEASPSLMVENSQTNPPVKVEENRDLNLSRQILGTSDQNTNQQAWQVGNNWGDHQFAGVNSSSTPTTHFI